MQTVVIPTDFSESANHAIKYATALFEGQDVKFVFLHAYQIPVTVPSTVIVGADMLKEKAQKQVGELVSNYRNTLKHDAASNVDEGEVVDVLNTYLKENPDAMVVMGTKGNSVLSEFLIGSNTVNAIRYVHQPVLIVPKESRIEKPRVIVYAADLVQGPVGVDLTPLTRIAEMTNAEIRVLHVTKGDSVENIKSRMGVEDAIEKALKHIIHSYHYEEGDDIAHVISQFADLENASMVAMVARHNKFLDRIFHQSVTKKVALHSRIPILSLHANS
ncbi:MAG: universal stress protein [Flavobacteriales bacterium]|nr:universal stress protein [Flavobacteriales bacterium]